MAKMNFVSTELSLPLYLLSRIPLKEERPEQVREYLAKKSAFYTRNCNLENQLPTATKKKFAHICGFYKSTDALQNPNPVRRVPKDPDTFKSWILPPNLYNTKKEPYSSRRGQGGAYWRKLHKYKSILRAENINPSFYNIPRDSNRMTNSCNKIKGHFITNARKRRPTTRSMVTDILSCYRDPNEPGPADYYPKNDEFVYNANKVVAAPAPNPYIFYDHLSVPMKPNSYIPKHISFNPAPGRYETRYPGICPCLPKRIYCPDLQLLIDKQHRLRFRRLPYTKIKVHLYCCPDWRHVEGQGHRHLFKEVKKKKPMASPRRNKQTRKTDKTVELYPDAKYIQLITAPKRAILSLRKEPMPKLQPRIFFNCIAKRIIRKQLRNNKKIAFLSGQERFKDIDRPPQMTQKQMEEARAKLPFERQLHDYPITMRPLAEIEGKLTETPQHMMAFYKLELRKPLFKFLPLPMPKLLVTEAEMRGKFIDGQYVPPNFYAKPIVPETYFKTPLEAKGENEQ